MRLTFLGTRSSSEHGNALHRRHSALLIEGPAGRLMIDCGGDWLQDLPSLAPDALLLTHAHSDHSAGLAGGAPCQVYATAETWQRMPDYPINEPRDICDDQVFTLAGLEIEAVPLHHSLRAPAVGYRLRSKSGCLFYAPDVAALIDAQATLKGCDLYIGDGSALDTSLLRREQDLPCGHAPILEQLQWCHEAGVANMIVTHCGQEIIADERAVRQRLNEAATALGIDLFIARDGMRYIM